MENGANTWRAISGGVPGAVTGVIRGIFNQDWLHGAGADQADSDFLPGDLIVQQDIQLAAAMFSFRSALDAGNGAGYWRTRMKQSHSFLDNIFVYEKLEGRANPLFLERERIGRGQFDKHFIGVRLVWGLA